MPSFLSPCHLGEMHPGAFQKYKEECCQTRWNPCTVDVNVHEEGKLVHLQISNDGTPVQKSVHGDGLHRYAQVLQAYGGKLEWKPMSASTKCFEVNAYIPK